MSTNVHVVRSWAEEAPTYTFEAGRAGDHPAAYQYVNSKSRAGYLAAREAARDWRRASLDHAETSFYGADRIRALRGFWLGVAFGIRERDGRRPAALPLFENSAPVSGLCREGVNAD